jgi:hypothetical protein
MIVVNVLMICGLLDSTSAFQPRSTVGSDRSRLMPSWTRHPSSNRCRQISSGPLWSSPKGRQPPLLDEWRILPNGRVEGKVMNHPDPEVPDGSTISTSLVVETEPRQPMSFFFPLPRKATAQQQPSLQENMTVETYSGSQYQLLKPFEKELEQQQLDEEMSETKKLMKQVKDAGIAGVISYALWEFGFWTVSAPVCIVAYRQVTGHWPDFSSADDVKQLGAEAFAFVNVARFAVPLRIGLALGTTPWIQKNIVDRFMTNTEKEDTPFSSQ